MTDTPPEEIEDDEFPPVHFSLRNPSGEDGELTLRQPILGIDLYVLITPGPDGPVVEGSHLDLTGLSQVLGIVLGALMVCEDIDDDVKDEIRELLAKAELVEDVEVVQ